MAQKKTSQRDENLVEAPVKVRVYRTVKKRLKGEAAESSAAGDQEAPDQEPSEAGDDPDLETIEVRRFVTEPARVRFHFDVSRNAHFQSTGAGVSVELPCYVEEIEEGFEEAKRIVMDRMRPAVKELKDVLDYLVDLRVKKDRELSNQGIV